MSAGSHSLEFDTVLWVEAPHVLSQHLATNCTWRSSSDPPAVSPRSEVLCTASPACCPAKCHSWPAKLASALDTSCKNDWVLGACLLAWLVVACWFLVWLVGWFKQDLTLKRTMLGWPVSVVRFCVHQHKNRFELEAEAEVFVLHPPRSQSLSQE